MERKTFTNKEGEDFSYLVHQSEGNSKNFVFFHATGFNSETYKILFDKLLRHMFCSGSMRPRKVAGSCASINRPVAGATNNTLKVTQPSSSRVRQAISFAITRPKKNSPHLRERSRHVSSLNENCAPKNNFITAFPRSQPPRSRDENIALNKVG